MFSHVADTVERMLPRALHKVRAEGVRVDPDAVAALSPYVRSPARPDPRPRPRVSASAAGVGFGSALVAEDQNMATAVAHHEGAVRPNGRRRPHRRVGVV